MQDERETLRRQGFRLVEAREPDLENPRMKEAPGGRAMAVAGADGKDDMSARLNAVQALDGPDTKARRGATWPSIREVRTTAWFDMQPWRRRMQ